MFRRANIKLVIYEIEGIPAISHVNPHVPVPCIIPPNRATVRALALSSASTDSTTFLTPFPFTCAHASPSHPLPLSSPLVSCGSHFYVRPREPRDAPIFSPDLFPTGCPLQLQTYNSSFSLSLDTGQKIFPSASSIFLSFFFFLFFFTNDSWFFQLLLLQLVQIRPSTLQRN